MKYAVYEHPITRRFALVPLPARFVDGDAVPLTNNELWFDTRDERGEVTKGGWFTWVSLPVRRV